MNISHRISTSQQSNAKHLCHYIDTLQNCSVPFFLIIQSMKFFISASSIRSQTFLSFLKQISYAAIETTSTDRSPGTISLRVTSVRRLSDLPLKSSPKQFHKLQYLRLLSIAANILTMVFFVFLVFVSLFIVFILLILKDIFYCNLTDLCNF